MIYNSSYDCHDTLCIVQLPCHYYQPLLLATIISHCLGFPLYSGSSWLYMVYSTYGPQVVVNAERVLFCALSCLVWFRFFSCCLFPHSIYKNVLHIYSGDIVLMLHCILCIRCHVEPSVLNCLVCKPEKIQRNCRETERYQLEKSIGFCAKQFLNYIFPSFGSRTMS